MKKKIMLALLPLAAALLGGCASTPPSDIGDACAIFAEKRGWERSAQRAEQRWGAPIHLQLAFIHQESSFLAKARPPRGRFLGVIPTSRASSAYGYAQAKDSTWDWYRERTSKRRARRTNFADAVDFIGWYVDMSHRTLGIAKSDARNQYLAYHEGHGGYKRRTYQNKAWLVQVAGRVERNAERYRQQLAQCSSRRGHGRRLSPF